MMVPPPPPDPPAQVAPAPVPPGPVVVSRNPSISAGLTNSQIDVDSDYSGTSLVMYGAVFNPGDDPVDVVLYEPNSGAYSPRLKYSRCSRMPAMRCSRWRTSFLPAKTITFPF